MTNFPPLIPFCTVLRRGTRVALLVSAGSLLLLGGSSDPAAAIRLGTPLDEVVATLGQPEKTDKARFGLVTNLYYGTYKIVVRGGVVKAVQNLKPPPKEAKDPAPARAVVAPSDKSAMADLKPEAEDAQDAEEGRLGGAGTTVAATPPVAARVAMPVVVPGPVPPKAAQVPVVPVVMPATVDAPEPVVARVPAVVPAPAPVVVLAAPPVPMPAPAQVLLPEAIPLPPPAAVAPVASDLLPAPVAKAMLAEPLADLPAALAQGVQRVGAVPAEHWTLRLEVANQPDTVRKAPSFFKGDKPDVFVLSVPAAGGTTYHVFYGDFATREAAERVARQLPAAFGHPAALKYQKLRSLVPIPK